MKLFYDNIIFSLQKAGGISIYWFELLKRVKENQRATFFELENKNIFRQKLDIFSNRECNLGMKFLRYFPFTKKLPPRSIFHSSYYRVSLQKDIVNITTVHDFTYEYFKKGLAKYIHIWQKGFAIKKSDGIICVSQNTKKDLLKFYPFIEISKIKVIYNGVGEEFYKLKDSHHHLMGYFDILKDKKYILYIGDRSSYKNFHIAINVLKKLNDYSFVIVGGKEFDEKEKMLMLEIQNKVFHFSGICGEKLNVLYNNAFCLLYPSSYEGFGIPLIEAMKAGCPVVSTKFSSIPEVAGEAALLVDKIGVENFVQKIKELENQNIRKKLIEMGLSQASWFSWDKCFDETYSFYKEIWNKKFT